MAQGTKFTVGILCAICLVAAGCSSTTGPSSSPPQFSGPTFRGPGSTSASADTSTGAQVAATAALDLNTIVQDFLLFFSGSETSQGSGWVWVKQSTGLTVTATAAPQGPQYSVMLVFNGVYQNQTFNNSTVLTGSMSADGRNGTWTLTVPGENAQLTWSTDNLNTLTATMTVQGTNEVDTLIDRADNSGELKVYDGTRISLDVTWKSNGSGQWVSYDPTSGNVSGSGSWT